LFHEHKKVSVHQKQGYAGKYNPDGWRFFGRPERPGLAFGSGHGVTFAREIKNKSIQGLKKKEKGKQLG
jgi:hypothetical protein